MTVDAQAIANNMPEDVLYARYSQSIAVTRDFGAPKPHGSQMGISSIVSRDVLDTAKCEPSSRRTTERSTLRRARRIQHQMECAEYMAKAKGPPERVSDSDIEECDTSEDALFPRRPKASAVFKQMLKYNPLQACVIETLWTAEQASLGECVKALTALANPKPFKPFYPYPVLPPKKNGNCPYCCADIFAHKVGHGRRAEHLLQCHQAKHFVSFCLQCAMFVDDRLWSGHQCLDLDLEHSGIYGVILWRNLVISEGRCPYGVGRSCEQRRWRDLKLLNHHIEVAHLKKKPEGAQKCPSEACGVFVPSKSDLRSHFHRTHRIHMKRSTCVMSAVSD